MIKFLAPYTPTYHYLLYFQDSRSFSTNLNSIGANLGVCHADDLVYLWDMFGLNDGTGIYDLWWNADNKLNSKRLVQATNKFLIADRVIRQIWVRIRYIYKAKNSTKNNMKSGNPNGG